MGERCKVIFGIDRRPSGFADVVLGMLAQLSVCERANVDVWVYFRGTKTPGQPECEALVHRIRKAGYEPEVVNLQIVGDGSYERSDDMLEIPYPSSAMHVASICLELASLMQPVASSPKTLLEQRDALVAGRVKASSGTQGRPVVAFIAQFVVTWGSVADCFAALERSGRVQVEIVAFESTIKSVDTNTADYFAQQGIPVRDAAWFRKMLHDPQSGLAAVFGYEPWDHLRPSDLSYQAIASRGIPIFYMTYGASVGGYAYTGHHAYNMPAHQLASRIYSYSESYRLEMAERCDSGNAHVRVLGAPKYDQIWRIKQRDDSLFEDPVVLWNPQFSTEKGGFSTFIEMTAPLVKFFESHPRFTLIARPHPRVWDDAEKEGGEYLAAVTALRDAAHRLDNVEIDRSSSYHESFARSTCLVSDLSSLIAEFLVLGKPILYLHRHDGGGTNAFGDFLFALDVAGEWRDVELFLEGQRAGKDEKKWVREYFLDARFPPIDGRSGERIADDLLSTLVELGFSLPEGPASERADRRAS